MTPTRVSSSQAAMSGRDVFWDYDTPESRRTRTKMAAQMENLAGSPRSKPSETLTQLRLFKPKNKSKSSASVGDQHCGEVLEKKEHKDLWKHEESRPESSIASQVKKEEDMFGESDPFADDF